MPNTPFDDIERLRSECSLMDKAAKVAYLRGRLQQLNNLAYQMTLYLRSKGYTTEAEKQQALWLVETKYLAKRKAKVEGKMTNFEIDHQLII